MASPDDILARIEELRAAAAVLRAEGLPNVAAGLERWLDCAAGGLTLEQALGVAVGARDGQRRWWTLERQARWHRNLAEYARRYCAGNAKRLERDIQAYRRRWEREWQLAEPPAVYAGTGRELLFRAFHDAGGKIPGSAKQLRRILAKGHQVPPSGVPSELLSSPRIEGHSQCRQSKRSKSF